MIRDRKVIHVELKNPQTGFQRNYYFGSIAAIYDLLPKDMIGIGKESLWARLKSGDYENSKVIIRKSRLITKLKGTKTL